MEELVIFLIGLAWLWLGIRGLFRTNSKPQRNTNNKSPQMLIDEEDEFYWKGWRL